MLGGVLLAAMGWSRVARAETYEPKTEDDALGPPAPPMPAPLGTLSSLEEEPIVEPGLEATPDTLPRGLARPTKGFEMGIRGSYGVPFGGSSEETGVRDLIAGIFPVQLDFGYRFDPRWSVSGFIAGGIGVKGTECRTSGDRPEPSDDENGNGQPLPGTGVECDAPNQFRAGIQVLFHLRPVTEDTAPWVGLGVGYEWLRLSETLGRSTFVQTLSGLEIVNFQVGVDLAAGSHLRVAPFAQWSLGVYSRVSADASGDAEPLPAPDGTLHHWLNLGIKVTVGPLGG